MSKESFPTHSVKLKLVIMTIWQPDLTRFPGPRYRAIAEALAADLREGRLRPGDRLPTHRDLAWRLRVTVGTVRRAYAEAARRGLIEGEVGRGTFIRAPVPASVPDMPAGPNPAPINLAQGHPVPGPEAALLGEALRDIAATADLADLLRYQLHNGRAADRAAAADWLLAAGVPAAPERVIITAGAQHSIATILSALTSPGDVVATEAMTYPGFKAAAQLHYLRVEGVAVDQEGLRPDAFAALCRAVPIRLLYCSPNLCNPLAGVLSLERRRAIVEIARRHDVILVEDDVFGFLIDRPPSLAELAPERALHATSLSKCLAPGLRVGFILAPGGMLDRLMLAMRGSLWMAPPLMVELVTRWIRSGVAADLAAGKRQEARRRLDLARAAFGNRCAMPDASYHFWLPLPESWGDGAFAAEALRRGVAVTPGAGFSVARTPPLNGVRICISPPDTVEAVEHGLKILAGLLAEEPDPLMSIV
jgi:DNA-binding transcriptional MocR family regulator